MKAAVSTELRASAARLVAAVREGRSLNDSLEQARARFAAAADRALLQQIVFGVLRDYRLLETIARRWLAKPPRRRDRLVLALILVGLFQLRSLRVPAYAAVSETVAACDALGIGRLRGLVNAVLRRYQREPPSAQALEELAPAVLFSHPDWLAESLRADWPAGWPDILAANNQPGPLSLRVNPARGTREGYLARLRAEGIQADAGTHADSAVVLAEPVAIERLPGFADGDVSVQDQAAQLAAPLLQAPPGARILDACAAPGGKTAHLLERYPDARVVAVDGDAGRLDRVRSNLARLGLRADVRAGDAAEPATWWDGTSFDRILIDAPCSGTGVIRRHPDIKWLRRHDDIEALARGQRRLLEGLWPLLAPGGELLYATCSALSRENEAVVAAFVADHAQCSASPVIAPWGESTAHGRRIRPGESGMDGFFYARLRRVAEGDSTTGS